MHLEIENINKEEAETNSIKQDKRRELQQMMCVSPKRI